MTLLPFYMQIIKNTAVLTGDFLDLISNWIE